MSDNLGSAAAGLTILVMALVVLLGLAVYRLAVLLGLTRDPEPLPWEESPGARTDRERLLDEGRVR